MKLPAIHLYPGDWLRDTVAGCSLAAQGLWLRMMFLMHDSERYGYLIVNGSPMTSESIARRCGCTPTEYETLYGELDAAGVPSRTKGNLIFSRRMARDADERQQNAERQQRFRNGQRNGQGNGKVTPRSRPSNPPSSTSVSISASRKKNTGGAHAPPLSDHQKMMKELADQTGAISDGKAQGEAIKWLLSHEYGADESTACLRDLVAELKNPDHWRKSRVSWLTVKKEIGSWKLRGINGHAAEVGKPSEDFNDPPPMSDEERVASLRLP